eukprot:4189204-Prymnesium_polylepis.1
MPPLTVTTALAAARICARQGALGALGSAPPAPSALSPPPPAPAVRAVTPPSVPRAGLARPPSRVAAAQAAWQSLRTRSDPAPSSRAGLLCRQQRGA